MSLCQPGNGAQLSNIISPENRLWDLVTELLENGMKPEAVMDNAMDAIRDFEAEEAKKKK